MALLFGIIWYKILVLFKTIFGIIIIFCMCFAFIFISFLSCWFFTPHFFNSANIYSRIKGLQFLLKVLILLKSLSISHKIWSKNACLTVRNIRIWSKNACLTVRNIRMNIISNFPLTVFYQCSLTVFYQCSLTVFYQCGPQPPIIIPFHHWLFGACVPARLKLYSH